MDRKVGKRLSYLMKHHRCFANERLKAFELSYVQANVLLHLSKEKRLTQEELAHKMLLDKARISRLIKVLEEKQYIYKTCSKKDKRARDISLSQKGEKMITTIITILGESSERMLKNISDEEARLLISLLDRLCDNVSMIGDGFHE
ncbi:MAG: MarR family transcriptional regulator [Erysipelotrichia bacterium]|nr:MarR family transcriptional regulator [Erysipelotrichia bacterium]NCC54598.1 MarR family transcriptional regulator [Erysipelotrichia bacterium]